MNVLLGFIQEQISTTLLNFTRNAFISTLLKVILIFFINYTHPTHPRFAILKCLQSVNY